MGSASQTDMLDTLFNGTICQHNDNFIIIDGYLIPYTVNRKRIRNSRLEFKLDSLNLVIHPGEDPQTLINRHKKWVLGKHLEICKILDNPGNYPLRTGLDRKGLLQEAELIVSSHENELSVKAKSIKVRKMTATWGSLNPDGIITLSSMTRFLPNELLHYILYHEVLHLKRMNHGKIFRRYMNRKFPGRMKLERRLYAYWLIIRKMRD